MKQTRREFLKTSAMAAAIAAVPSIALAAREPDPERFMSLYFEKALGTGKWYRVEMPTSEYAMRVMKEYRRQALDKPIKVLADADLIVHWEEDDDSNGEVFNGLTDNNLSLNPDQISEEYIAILKTFPITDIDTVIKEQLIKV